MFHVYSGKCSSHKMVHNWVKKFSQGRSHVADGNWPGRPVLIETEATALGGSHDLVCSILHYCLNFQKVCARWMSRELNDWGGKKKWIQWICPCNISYSMKMKEKILVCITGLLLGMNHCCITTNLNESVFQCNGNVPVYLRPKSLRLHHQLGRYAYHV
jgi:hypothetical protein